MPANCVSYQGLLGCSIHKLKLMYYWSLLCTLIWFLTEKLRCLVVPHNAAGVGVGGLAAIQTPGGCHSEVFGQKHLTGLSPGWYLLFVFICYYSRFLFYKLCLLLLIQLVICYVVNQIMSHAHIFIGIFLTLCFQIMRCKLDYPYSVAQIFVTHLLQIYQQCYHYFFIKNFLNGQVR